MLLLLLKVQNLIFIIIRILIANENLGDLWDDFLWCLAWVVAQSLSIGIELYVSVGNNFVNWVVSWSLAKSVPHVHHFADVEAIEADEGPETNHVSEVEELLQVLLSCLVSWVAPNVLTMILNQLSYALVLEVLVPVSANAARLVQLLHVQKLPNLYNHFFWQLNSLIFRNLFVFLVWFDFFVLEL